MGWTSFPMHEPVKEWFTRNWNDDKRKVLDVAIVKRNTLYAAIQLTETQEVFAVIYLLRWSRDVYNFSYKDMTEFAGPCQYECPERIINLLTDLEDIEANKYAIEWRKNVREYWDERKRLKSGGIIKTEEPLKFNNGSSYQYFKKIDRKLYAGDIIDGCFRAYIRVRVNLSNFKYSFL